MPPHNRITLAAIALAGLAATPAIAQVRLEASRVYASGSAVTVHLDNTYVDPVVVCAPNYTNTFIPLVVRVSNVTATSFDVRFDSPAGNAVTTADAISYIVMEAGVWNIGGVLCEAHAYTSTVTDENDAWVGEAQSYGQAYAAPVVIGQVMTENDPDWSVFWCRGPALDVPPSPFSLVTGKTVCEDTDVTRADETVGYMVFETEHGTIGGVEFETNLGPDTVRGIGNGAPIAYPYNTVFAGTPTVGIVTMAGVDGIDGGWAVTMGSPSGTSSVLRVGIDEDTIGDAERSHPPEQLGYAVFAGSVVYSDDDCTDDADNDGTPDCFDGCPNDPDKIEPGVCGCGVPDDDGDSDGTPDCIDGCPDDPDKIAPGVCGCGVPDDDGDSDGTPDCIDGCPDDPDKIAPGICGCGVPDDDGDSDGTPDCIDGCPDDPDKIAPGICGCGVPDDDGDSDGTPDCIDGCPDDPDKIAPGICGCGVPDDDSDSDGTPDCSDGCPDDPDKTSPGACGCGVPDDDGDDDGLPDCIDNCPGIPNDQADCDDDGTGDACAGEPDCNDNDVPDSCDITDGTSFDSNGNGIPDECEDPPAVLLSNVTPQSQLLCLHDPDGNGTLWQTGGMAVGDFNRDGHPDLFAVTGAHDTDKLFINNGTGVFAEQGAAWGLTAEFVSNAAAVGDIDGDGWLDLFVTAFGSNRLYRNNGGTSFTDIAASAGVDLLPAGVTASDTATFGAAFGDYDLDGDLDLMVANWQSCCLFDCFGCGSGNRLYRNNGDLTFTDVTVAAFGTATNGIVGFQPCFTDMDGDLYPELLIAADFESSRYFVNNGDGTFTDQTISAGTGLDDNGMGQAIADFDNDLQLDWYVTSIHKDEPLPGDMFGNMLYHNTGPHVFEERSVEAGVNNGGWGWGTIALDLDLDGLVDIVEVNGREAPDGEWEAEQAYMFHNEGDMTFTEIAQPAGFIHNDSGRAVVSMDSETDGDLDVVVFTAQGPLYYFRNDSAASGHRWLEISFDTSNNPGLAPDGFGARIEATFQGAAQVRFVDGHPSYLGTSQLIAHFGFGTGPQTLDELRVTWPRGQVTILTDVAIDRRLTLHAPDPADITADGRVDVDDLVRVITAWGLVTDSTSLAADIDRDGEVEVDDLVAVIAAWGPATEPMDP